MIVVALLLYTGSLGIHSRRRRQRRRDAMLARHARIAPYCWALVLFAWLAGAWSSSYLRDDLSFAASNHFWLGTALLAVLSAGLLASRFALRGSSAARELHVWLGVAALLLAVAQVVSGLRIGP